MKKGVIIFILLTLLINFSFSSSLKIKNDETIYVLLDYDGQVKRVDLVNWVSLEGRGSFNIVKEGKSLKDVKIFTEDVNLKFSSGKIYLSGKVEEYKNIYLKGELLKDPSLQFNISYRYNGRLAKPSDFLGKQGDLDIEFKIKSLEDIPFRVVISTEFSADDFILKNPEDFMVMVLGKTIRLSSISFPISESKIKLSLRSKKLKIPAFTFTALPSIPPLDLSIKDQLKKFSEGLEALLLLNQVHQKILKGILENFEKQTPAIPQEFFLLPFTLTTNQNKAYAVANSLKNYPKGFEELYDYIKENAKETKDERWQKALNMAEKVKKEMQEKNPSEDIRSIGDFLGDLAFSSKKALDLLGTSLEGLRKMEELLNIMLNGGEIEGKNLPGLSEVEKTLRSSSKELKENISKLNEGEKKIKSWERKLKDYSFVGKISGAESVVRFYFRLEELSK